MLKTEDVAPQIWAWQKYPICESWADPKNSESSAASQVIYFILSLFSMIWYVNDVFSFD